MKIMQKTAFWAGFLGLSGVVLGAFGAHALRTDLEGLKTTQTWDTAVKYHLVHAVALLALAAWGRARSGSGVATGQKTVAWAAVCWVVGVVLFSGSLYALALGGPRWLGPVTPLGGLALMAGWILVMVAASRE